MIHVYDRVLFEYSLIQIQYTAGATGYIPKILQSTSTRCRQMTGYIAVTLATMNPIHDSPSSEILALRLFVLHYRIFAGKYLMVLVLETHLGAHHVRFSINKYVLVVTPQCSESDSHGVPGGPLALPLPLLSPRHSHIPR